MKTFWFVAAIFFSITVIAAFKKNEKIITAYNAVYVMTLGNFLLYLQRWSYSFTQECADVTYYVMGMVCIVFGAYAILDNRKGIEAATMNLRLRRILVGRRICASSMFLVLCIVLTAIENVYNAGSIIAPDSSVFHTDAMPVIGTVVRGLYPVAYGMAYLDWMAYKRKGPLILCIICVLFALLGAGSRYWSTVSLLTAVVFVFEYNRDAMRTVKAWQKLLITLLGVLLFIIFLNLGESRTGNQKYADWIQYNGPFQNSKFGLVISWFYGYFPFSFHNLNNTLVNLLENGIRTYGQFAAYPIAAFLHVDALLGMDITSLSTKSRIIVNTAATVPTGWYEWFADFGFLFILFVVLMIWITHLFGRKRNLFGIMSYASMTCAWFLMAFNNVFLSGIFVYTIFFSWIVQRYIVMRD